MRTDAKTEPGCAAVPVPPPTREREAFVRVRFEAHFGYLARMALGFGAIAVLALAPLDYVVVPAHFQTFALYRLATALTMFLLLALFTRLPSFNGRIAIGFCGAVAVATMVALMIRDFGGHRSVYFAGFLLIFVFVSCYLPLRPLLGAAISLLVYAIYLLPILAYDTISDRPFFIAANVLMIACVGSMLVLQNVSYRRILNEYALLHEIGRNRDELAIANRELEAFSYSVSHDLRAPLRTIHGFASILREQGASALDDEGRRCLERILAGAARMGCLVDDLLAFARLGLQEARRAQVAPGQIVAAVLEELRSSCPGRAPEVRVGDLPACRADPAMLRQVFANLLANSFKFTRERDDARVEVSCSREDGWDVYAVRDNGTGFDMRYAGKLFGVFQRLHGEDDYEGTGVGLAIAKRIVEKHGGRIWAEAAPGAGATFRFTLQAERDGGGAERD